MIKVDKINVWGFEHAIRGMRNPMNSWKKSDSEFLNCGYMEDFGDNTCEDCIFGREDMPDSCFNSGYFVHIGPNDLELMKKLYKGGPEHRKYLRQIMVSMDILAPLYWWKEFDTYKVGTTANSCSTMHKIHAKEFVIDDFSHDELDEFGMAMLGNIINYLNENRRYYISTKKHEYWWQMIQILPTSYNQLRTVTMNYENVVNIINQRFSHKLTEWPEFVDILSGLPFIKDIFWTDILNTEKEENE